MNSTEAEENASIQNKPTVQEADMAEISTVNKHTVTDLAVVPEIITTTSEATFAITSETLIKHHPGSTTAPQNHMSTTPVNNTTALGKTTSTAGHGDNVVFGNNHISSSKSTSGDDVVLHREFSTVSKEVTLDTPRNVNSTASGNIPNKEYVTSLSSGDNISIKETKTILENITTDDTYYTAPRNMATDEDNSDSTVTAIPVVVLGHDGNAPVLKEIVPVPGDNSTITSGEKLSSSVFGDAFNALPVGDTAPAKSLGSTTVSVDTTGSKETLNPGDYTTDKGDVTVVPEGVINSTPHFSDPGEVFQTSFKETFPISSEVITVLSEGVTDNLSTSTFSAMFQLPSTVVSGSTISLSDGNSTAVENPYTTSGSGDRPVEGNKTNHESRDTSDNSSGNKSTVVGVGENTVTSREIVATSQGVISPISSYITAIVSSQDTTETNSQREYGELPETIAGETITAFRDPTSTPVATIDATDTIPTDITAGVVARGANTRNAVSILEDGNTIAASGPALTLPQNSGASASEEGTATTSVDVTEPVTPRERATTHVENICASTITHSFSSAFENTTFTSLTPGHTTSPMGENTTSTGSRNVTNWDIPTSAVEELPSIATEKSLILNRTTTDFLPKDPKSTVTLGDPMDILSSNPSNTPEMVTNISDPGDAITAAHGDTDTTVSGTPLTSVHSSITHVTEPKGTMNSLKGSQTFSETVSSAVMIGIQVSTNDVGNIVLEESVRADLNPTSSDDIISRMSEGKLDSTSTHGDICNETNGSDTTSSHNTAQGRNVSVVPFDSKTPSDTVELVPGDAIPTSEPAANISLLSREMSRGAQEDVTSTSTSDFAFINVGNSGGISTDPTVSPRRTSVAISIPCDTSSSALGEIMPMEERISSGNVKHMITPLEASTQPGSQLPNEAITNTVSFNFPSNVIHGDTECISELITSNLDTISTLGDMSRIPGTNISFGNSMAPTKCLQGTSMPVATGDIVRPGDMTSIGISRDPSIITFAPADETSPRTNINDSQGGIAINAAKYLPNASDSSVMSCHGDNRTGTTVDKYIITATKPSEDISTSVGDSVSGPGERDTITATILEDIHATTVGDTTSPENRIISKKASGSTTSGETVMSGQNTKTVLEDTGNQNESSTFKTVTFPGETSKTTVNFMPGLNVADRNTTSRPSTFKDEAILICNDAAAPVSVADENIISRGQTSSPQKSTDTSSCPTYLEDAILETSTNSGQIFCALSNVISVPCSGSTTKEASIIGTTDVIAEAQSPEVTTSLEGTLMPCTIVASEEDNSMVVTSNSQQSHTSDMTVTSGKCATLEATTVLEEITFPEVITEETFASKGTTSFIEAAISRSITELSVASNEVFNSPADISTFDTTVSSRQIATFYNPSSNESVPPEDITAITTNTTSSLGDTTPLDSGRSDEAVTSRKVNINFCCEPLSPRALTASAEGLIFEDVATNAFGDTNTPNNTLHFPENVATIVAENAAIVPGNNSIATENPLIDTTLGKSNYNSTRGTSVASEMMPTAKPKETIDTNRTENSASTPRQDNSAPEDSLIIAKEVSTIVTSIKITNASTETSVSVGPTSASGELSAAPEGIPTVISEETNIAILGETTNPTTKDASIDLGETVAIRPGETTEITDTTRDVSASMGQRNTTTYEDASTASENTLIGMKDASTASENTLIGTSREVFFSCSVEIPASEYDVTIIIHRKTSKTLNVARSGESPGICPGEMPSTVSAKATTLHSETSPAITRRNIPIAPTPKETLTAVSKEITSVFQGKINTVSRVVSPPYWFVLFLGILLMIILMVVGLRLIV